MFNTKKYLSRRTFLRGAGVTLALPFLEAMLPAQTPLSAIAASSKTRFAGIFFPHGMAPGYWVPKTQGSNFEFPFIMQPLEPFRDRAVVLSGLHARSAEPPQGVTGSDHFVAAAYLCATKPKKTTGADIQKYGQDYASNEYGNVYNRSMGEYQNRYNIYNQDQATKFNRLAAVSGVGQTAAGQLSDAGAYAARNAGDILMTSGQQLGQDYNNAGAARASGYVGGANAWGNAFGSGSNLMNTILLSRLFGGGGGQQPFGPVPYSPQYLGFGATKARIRKSTGLKPPEIANPLETYGSMLKLSDLLQQGKLNQQNLASGALRLRSEQQDEQDRQNLTRAFTDAGGDTDKTVALASKYGVSAPAVQKYSASVLEGRQKLETYTKDKLENISKVHGMLGEYAGAVQNLPPEQRPAALQQAVGELVGQGVLKQEDGQKLLQSAPVNDPQALDQWLTTHKVAAISAKEQVDQVIQSKVEQTAQGPIQQNPVTGQWGPITVNGQAAGAKPEQAREDERYRQIQQRLNMRQPVSQDDKAWAQGYEKQKTLGPTVIATGAGYRQDKTQNFDMAKDTYKRYDTALDADQRLSRMEGAYGKAVNGDQQAMLSLLTDHIGMTLGLQKGARITKDILNEATQSQPWLAKIESRFDNRGYLSGVTLGKDQMSQMLDLGYEARDRSWQSAQDASQMYGVEPPKGAAGIFNKRKVGDKPALAGRGNAGAHPLDRFWK